ncbi:uncharacterized protein DS421_5g151020 [Arachis hypogaea]|nr:uncharacterized protein DS421_5g151020 [Arachis hypogaea]
MRGKGDPEEERAPGKQQLAGQPRSAAMSSSLSITLPFATTTAPITPSLGRTESRRGWLANVGGHGLGAAASPSPPRPRRAAASVRHTVTPSRVVASRVRERRAVRRVATALSHHHFLSPSRLASLSLMAVAPTVLHSGSGLSAPLSPLEAVAEAGLLWWLLSLSVAGEDETR